MTLIYFILILGITILIHEFGHFIWAKKTGVYVYEFSIGMGPRVHKWVKGETEYSIRLLPIGGYVSLAGEEAEPNKKIPKGKSLQDKSTLEKVIIMVAGVINNFILAFILLFIVGLFTGYTNHIPVVGSVSPSTPAYMAGMEVGDRIVKVNGKNTNNTDKLLLELTVMKSDEVSITLKRGNTYKDINISATKEEVNGNLSYRMGFTLDTTNTKGFVPAIKYAFTKFISLFEQMIFIIIYLFSGKLALNNLSGPVGIYVLVGSVAKTGFMNILYLMAYISLNVGIINILPFPAFDGGRLFLLIIEKIRGKKISQKVENSINTIGFALLMLLMVYVTLNDILNLL